MKTNTMSQYFTYQNQEIASGDTVRVHQEIVEGKKKRIQIFEGLVIAIKGSGNGKSFTVRRIAVGSVGVEKIFPIMLPNIKKIEVKRKGQVRRAKLYYLRDRIGKKASKVKEKSTLKAATKSA
jgi:large subunit ribosomal protein L19